MSLAVYDQEVTRVSSALRENTNAQAVQQTLENDKAGILVRPYFYSNLFDRIHTRPFLNLDEKRWIAFQLFQALAMSHSKNVSHGDIKIDNVLLTSWNWVYLSDYASFKPTHLPADNPAAFSYFFDISGRRTCGIAPERFYDPDPTADAESQSCRFDGKVTPAMDIFSLGCVIYEMMTDGKHLYVASSINPNPNPSPNPSKMCHLQDGNGLKTCVCMCVQQQRSLLFTYQPLLFLSSSDNRYDLSMLLDFREGKLDQTVLLEAIPDLEIRKLVAHMTNLDPTKRLSAQQYLAQLKGKVFPRAFSDILHGYMRGYVSLSCSCVSRYVMFVFCSKVP
jgi:phosphoinositide-3-kinase regulatory subunit 4